MGTTIDIILISCSICAIIWGAYRGLTTQIMGILGIVLGLWLASKFTVNIATWINDFFDGEKYLDGIKIAVYIIFVILIVILCKLLGKLLDNIFNLTILGGVNRILGGLFCLLKVILIFAAIASIINYADNSLELDFVKTLKTSKGFNLLVEIADKVLPYIKSLFSLS